LTSLSNTVLAPSYESWRYVANYLVLSDRTLWRKSQFSNYIHRQ